MSLFHESRQALRQMQIYLDLNIGRWQTTGQRHAQYVNYCSSGTKCLRSSAYTPPPPPPHASPLHELCVYFTGESGAR